jgi:endonuclease YncB( thermonuclease family)
MVPSMIGIMMATAFAVVRAGESPVLVGTVTRVVDGDTIKVQLSSGPMTVRLDSIDTPKHDQAYGAEVTEATRRLVAGKEVQLEPVSQDRYERMVAVVFVGGLNVGETLVKDGHAWAFRRYAKSRDYCQ